MSMWPIPSKLPNDAVERGAMTVIAMNTPGRLSGTATAVLVACFLASRLAAAPAPADEAPPPNMAAYYIGFLNKGPQGSTGEKGRRRGSSGQAHRQSRAAMARKDAGRGRAGPGRRRPSRPAD